MRVFQAARKRFRQEAQAAQRLEHPDIVRVFDLGETGALAWIVERSPDTSPGGDRH